MVDLGLCVHDQGIVAARAAEERKVFTPNHLGFGLLLESRFLRTTFGLS